MIEVDALAGWIVPGIVEDHVDPTVRRYCEPLVKTIDLILIRRLMWGRNCPSRTSIGRACNLDSRVIGLWIGFVLRRSGVGPSNVNPAAIRAVGHIGIRGRVDPSSPRL